MLSFFLAFLMHVAGVNPAPADTLGPAGAPVVKAAESLGPAGTPIFTAADTLGPAG